MKATSTGAVANVKYEAQIPSESVTTEGKVSFVAIRLSTIDNVNYRNTVTTDDLVPGTNYKYVNPTGSGVGLTATMAEPDYPTTDYVVSQQVSTAGTDEHAVTMTGGYPEIAFPAAITNESAASKKVDPINYTSGKYHVYSQTTGENPYY